MLKAVIVHGPGAAVALTSPEEMVKSCNEELLLAGAGLFQKFPYRHCCQAADHASNIARQTKSEQSMPDQTGNNASHHNYRNS